VSNRKSAKVHTATHRPAIRKRLNRHDEWRAGEFFSGFGGLTQGIKAAGFDVIVAANHNEYKVEVHEANHPEVEHWIADLVDTEAPTYHDVRQLPEVDLLAAGVSCVNHSPSNSKRAYATGEALFHLKDPDYDAAVTRSERDRATANCVLHYAAVHHPLLILVECTTQLQSWGRLVPGSKKVGDGSTYRWWLKQFELLGYKHKGLFLNSRFFDGDQDRNRYFGCFWKEHLPTPDLEHRPISWCHRCSTEVEAVWTWKTGPTPTGKVAYGEQYNYRCPSCRTEVVPPSGYALRSLDLTNLGTRIGEMPLKRIKDKATGEFYESPLARATMARADRCRRKFPDFPAVLMPAKAIRGTEKHPWQPMATQTSQQETALLSTGAIMGAAGNTFERPGSDCRRGTSPSRCGRRPRPTRPGSSPRPSRSPSTTSRASRAAPTMRSPPRAGRRRWPWCRAASSRSARTPPRRRTPRRCRPSPPSRSRACSPRPARSRTTGRSTRPKYRAHPVDRPLSAPWSGPQSPRGCSSPGGSSRTASWAPRPPRTLSPTPSGR
jgi:DNA (cytosine-5)-methyltransferase 1